MSSYPRIYHPGPFTINSDIVLSETATHHLVHVLRKKNQDLLHLFDGLGREYAVEILEYTKKKGLIVRVIEEKTVVPESPLNLHLAQAISRPAKMDWVMQKAVELGVQQITPVITQHAVRQYAHDTRQKHHEHWQKVIIHACQQSGRAHLPLLQPALHFNDWIALPQIKYDLCIYLDPNSRLRLSDLALTPAPKQISLLVGPEGGFSPNECKAAEQQGYQGLRLGPRILRTETAALAILSAVQTRWGDF